jgi:hypothetical protein
MGGASESRIICCSIVIFEYLALSVFLLFKIKNRKTLGIEDSSVIKVFWAIALSQTSIRIIDFSLALFQYRYAYEVLERFTYIINCEIYSLICYTW